MKYIVLATSAFALMGMAPVGRPTGVMVTNIGGNSAVSCYHAATARDGSDVSLAECNAALGQESIPFDDLVATYVNRGVVKLLRNDYRSAEADFDQAMTLQASQPEAWLNKGIARYAQGDYRSAHELFSRALELKTNYAPLAYYGRALASEDAGDVRGAYEDLQRASQLDPKWGAPQDELKRFKVVHKASA